MKSSGQVVVILLYLLSCKSAHESCEFEGTYETGGFNYTNQLIIRLDHSFTITTSLANCFGGEKQSIVNGRFTTKDDKIFLSASTFHVVQHQLDSCVDRIIYDSTEVLSSVYRKIQECKDTLQILRWNEHLFILGADRGPAARTASSGYSNDMITLLNIYNRNPTQIKDYDVQQKILNSFRSKLCAECNEKDIEKALSDEWVDFILKAPIDTEITKADKVADRIIQYVVTVNAGLSRNVRPGMLFYPRQSDRRFDAITITDVFENYSKGTITIGTEIKPEVAASLTTRYSTIEDDNLR